LEISKEELEKLRMELEKLRMELGKSGELMELGFYPSHS
jgi:hypothetical protein